MFLISQDKEKGEVEMFERLTAAFSLFCFSLKLFLISCRCVRGLPDVWESSVENLKAVMENCGWKQAAVVISLCQWWVMKNYDNKDVMKFQWVSEKCLRLEALSSNSSSGNISTRFLPLSCGCVCVLLSGEVMNTHTHTHTHTHTLTHTHRNVSRLHPAKHPLSGHIIRTSQ